MYANDYDGSWPQNWIPRWKGDHPDLPTCPDAVSERDKLFISQQEYGVPGYGYNYHLDLGNTLLSDTVPSGHLPPAIKDTDILFPALSIALMDSDVKDPRGYCFDTYHNETYDYKEKAWQRHNDGANYAFVDGHVQWQNGSKGIPCCLEWVGATGNEPTFCVLGPIGKPLR